MKQQQKITNIIFKWIEKKYELDISQKEETANISEENLQGECCQEERFFEVKDFEEKNFKDKTLSIEV